MSLVAQYLGKSRRKATLLEEARATGAEYGAELAAAGMTLSQAMHAFTFFRRSLDQSAKQALTKTGTTSGEAVDVCEQIMALADEVLLGIATAYEHASDASPNVKRHDVSDQPAAEQQLIQPKA